MNDNTFKTDQISIKDYPLRKNMSNVVKTPDGITLDNITFENIQAGEVNGHDCRVSKEVLLMQAKIAEDNNNPHLAANFRRAAELVSIDSKRILEIYEALRPYRSTEEELQMIVTELKEKYNAPNTAAFIENSILISKKRKRLKGDR